MRRVFVHFLEEIEDSKKAFRNYLSFRHGVMVENVFNVIIIFPCLSCGDIYEYNHNYSSK